MEILSKVDPKFLVRAARAVTFIGALQAAISPALASADGGSRDFYVYYNISCSIPSKGISEPVFRFTANGLDSIQPENTSGDQFVEAYVKEGPDLNHLSVPKWAGMNTEDWIEIFGDDVGIPVAPGPGIYLDPGKVIEVEVVRNLGTTNSEPITLFGAAKTVPNCNQ